MSQPWYKKSDIMQENNMNSAYKKLSGELIMCRLRLTWRSNSDRFGVPKKSTFDRILEISIGITEFLTKILERWSEIFSLATKILGTFYRNSWTFDRNYWDFEQILEISTEILWNFDHSPWYFDQRLWGFDLILRDF